MRKPVLLTGSALALLLNAPLFPGIASATPAPCDNANQQISSAPGDTLTLNTPGWDYCYTVPAGVESIRATVVGGDGMDDLLNGGPTIATHGGHGAVAQGTIPVTAGQQIDMIVGYDGTSDGGFNAGGGASSIDRVLVAGAGGGAGRQWGTKAGPGGNAGADPQPGDGSPIVPGSESIAATGGEPGGIDDAGTGGAGGGGWFMPLDGAPGAGAYGGSAGYGNGVGSGGGGGNGYFGGGGGGQGGYDGTWSGGAGGGAGSSHIGDDVTGGAISTSRSGAPRIVITVGGAPFIGVSESSHLFSGVQPTGTLSAPFTLTLTNVGTAGLRVDRLTITGDDPDAFVVTGDTCRAKTAPGSTCQVFVRFAPQRTGTAYAMLEIGGNAWSGVHVEGTGGPLPAGDTGAAGAQGPIGVTGTNGATGPDGATGAKGDTGASGTKGATGATGAAGTTGTTGAKGDTGSKGEAGKDGTDGTDASTSCLILTAKTKDGQSATDVQCTVTSVAGKTGAFARLTRNGRTFATGTERKGVALKLRPIAGRTITAGHYRLVRTYRQAGRTVTERRQVTVS